MVCNGKRNGILSWAHFGNVIFCPSHLASEKPLETYLENFCLSIIMFCYPYREGKTKDSGGKENR